MKLSKTDFHLFLLFFSLLLSSSARLDNSEVGKRPEKFCTSHNFKEIIPDRYSISYPNHLRKEFSGDSISSIYLTQEGIQNKVGYVYYKSYQDWQNGFIVTFNMEISHPTCKYRDILECTKTPLGTCFWEKYSSIPTRCGADGFAFVLQSTSIDAAGLFGGGLGYKKLSNVFAIEFDTWFNEDLNDPMTDIERHISVITTPGQAEANEAQSIAWNDRPVNFKNEMEEGFVNNPEIRIEYLNKNLRVYVNGVIQIGYYDELNLHNLLQIANNKFFLGLTASTSAYTQNAKLTNFKIQQVLPSIENSFLKLRNINPKAGSFFVIDLYVRDGCRGKYIPIDGIDLIQDVELKSSDGCQLMGVKEEIHSTFALNFLCSKVGTKEIKLLYKKMELLPISVTIEANELSAIRLNITDGESGTVDHPFSFQIEPLDMGDNLALTTTSELLDKITIIWPNPVDTRKDYNLTNLSSGKYILSLNAEKLGIYTISSSLLRRQTGRETVSFTMNPGAPDPLNSICTIYKNMEGIREQLISGKINCGTSAFAMVVFRDKYNNSLGPQTGELKFQKLENGESSELEGPIGINNEMGFELTKKGKVQIQALYENQPLNCPFCFFDVLAAASDFSKSNLYKYDEAKNTFVPNPDPVYELRKDEVFRFLLVLKDFYGNELDSIVAEEYKATLSGNNMTSFNLRMTAYGTGVLIDVSDNNKKDYSKLVGRRNYLITVYDNKGAKKTYSLTIKSDGSDSDAGNGGLDPGKTKIAWMNQPISGRFCKVGEIYRISVKLMTVEGLRYPEWIDEGLIIGTIDRFYPNDGETITKGKKDSLPGTYIIELTITKYQTLIRKVGLQVNAITVASSLRFYDQVGEVFSATVVQESLKSPDELNSALVLQSSTFSLTTADKFNNLADPSKTPDFIFRTESQEACGFKPSCIKKSVGTFVCTFLPTSAGNFQLFSPLFENNRNKIKYYRLIVARGDPNSKFSEAGILNNVSSPLLAGTEVKFRIIVKDQIGSLLAKPEIVKNLNKFSLQLLYTQTNELINIQIQDTFINDSGEIILSKQVLLMGSYKFLPTLEQSPIPCMYCAFEINPAEIDPSKITMKILLGDNEKVLNPSSTVLIDNNKQIPLFQMGFQDIYGNSRGPDPTFFGYKGLLEITDSANKYTFLGNLYKAVTILFNIDGEGRDQLMKELATPDARITFSSKNDKNKEITVSYPVVLLGNEYDKQFSKETPDKAIIIPEKISSTAGEFITATIELRTPKGLLYFDENNNGFYPNSISKPFILTDETLNIDYPLLMVKYGKLNGTYIITFQPLKSTVSRINIKFINPKKTSSYISSPNYLDLTVLASSPAYLTSMSQLTSCIAGDSQILLFKVFDKYNNLIENPDPDRLGLTYTGNNGVIYQSKIKVSNSNVELVFECRKVDTITLTSISFMKNGENIDKYSFDVSFGVPSAKDSYAELDRDSILSGEKIKWSVYLFDGFGNRILDCVACSENIETVVTGEKFELSLSVQFNNEGDFYFAENVYEKSGMFRYQSFYGKAAISMKNNLFEVKASKAEWIETKLSMLNPSTREYAEYIDGDNWNIPIDLYPEFKLNFYDKFKNPASILSLKTWTSGVFLLDDNEKEANTTIILCPKNNSFDTFVLCDDNKLQPLYEPPKKRWTLLLTNIVYKAIMTKTENNLSEHIFGGLLNITSNATDSGTSNLPIDLNNTLISPNFIRTKAGEEFKLIIELRTVNKNLRPNFFFDNPESHLKIKSLLDQVETKLEKGDKKGIYIFSIVSYKTYSELNPNTLIFSLDGTEFKGSQPSLVVQPGDIENLMAWDTERKIEIVQLKSSSVDQPYVLDFKAYDKWKNVKQVSENDFIIISLQDSNKNNQNFKKSVVNGFLHLEFQPISPDNYTLQVKNSTYIIQITQGNAFESNCFGMINISIDSNVTAGSYVALTMFLQDKWGNKILLTPEALKNLKPKYYFRRPDVVEGFIIGNNSVIARADSIVFEQQVIVKGVYKFKMTLNDKEITLQNSVVNVIPSEISLKNCIFSFYDVSASRYIPLNPLFTLSEDNIHHLPSYTLALADRYDNKYETFPVDLMNKFTFILTGNDFAINKNPIKFTADSIIGNYLLVLIDKTDESYKNRYQSATYETTPYTFEIEFTTYNEKINFPVKLMGEGDKDNDAEIDVPLDITKTLISKGSLEFKAGESDSFIIELRTVNNKRKADASPSFKFNFYESALLNNKDYGFSVIPGDLRGRFLVTINGTKSTIRTTPARLEVFIDNIQTPKSVIITIRPSSLKLVNIPTILLNSTTDSDYLFEVIPYDEFKNIVDVEESDVNLKIVYPANSLQNSYSTTKNLSSGSLIYSLKARIIGLYQIQSPLMKEIRTFFILSGRPSHLYSKAIVKSNDLIVNESNSISLFLFDSYNNRITPTSDGKLSEKNVLCVGTSNKEQNSYNFIIDSTKNWFAPINTQKSGILSIDVSINSISISCINCTINWRPAKIELSKTEFYIRKLNFEVVRVEKFQILSGSESLDFSVKFFDKFENQIEKFDANERFVLFLSGNEMDLMTLMVSQLENSLEVGVAKEDIDTLSRLVPANDYIIELRYYIKNIDNDYLKINMDILGDNNGAGNGKWMRARVNPFFMTLKAGEESFSNVDLLTASGKRFNGILNMQLLSFKQIPDDGSVSRLTIKFYNGNYNGRFVVGYFSKKSELNKNITVKLAINKQEVDQEIFIQIAPAEPAIEKTQIVQDLPSSLPTDQSQEISFLFFDRFDNQYTSPELANRLFPKTIMGNASFEKIFMNSEKKYVSSFVPSYPPRAFSLMVYYKLGVNITVPIFVYPLSSVVTTSLDPFRSELVGRDLGGVRVDDALEFDILLKDNKGFCFEDKRNVSVVMDGPYLNGVLDESRSIRVNKNAEIKVANISENCNRFYSIKFNPYTFSKAGFYKIELFIAGENQGKSVKSYNKTFMRAGITSPDDSVLSVPGLLGRGSQALELEVNSSIIYRIQTYDNFDNIITEDRHEKVELKIKGYDSSQYIYSFKDNNNGSFDITLTVNKTGNISTIFFFLSYKPLPYEKMTKYDVPNLLIIKPGPCSSQFPSMDIERFSKENVTIGDLINFKIYCRDRFNNALTTGGSQFITLMTGTDLETVSIDYPNTQINDNKDGSYTYSFRLSWAGAYKIIIKLAGEPYGIPINITAVRSRCPSSEKTYYCENTGQCAASFNDCGYDFICKDPIKPYKCLVNKKESCVRGHFECDCPEGFIKCQSDNKCIPTLVFGLFCPISYQFNCPSEFPFLCEGVAQCRISADECPSQPGCPASYMLCADQTCALKSKGCPEALLKNAQECPDIAPYRCEDLTCVEEPRLCRSRITCPKPLQVICPDRTCADHELLCRPPASCDNFTVLCPDQSCRKNVEDCPKSITCAFGHALCQDRTCQYSCTTGASIKRMLARITQSENSIKIICPKDYEVCPGGECVSNRFLCPTVHSCPPNTRLCPDFSCASVSQQCVAKSCPVHQTLCWDGKCVDIPSQCPTRSLCPSPYSTKCSDGSCVISLKNCPKVIPCPLSAPYRCGTGDCRTAPTECPTLITCPMNRPISCPDGSCVKGPDQCLIAVSLIKCSSDQILCPDGSCATSRHLCPSISTCPPGQIRCWDSACAPSLEECDHLEDTKEICPSNLKLRCPDGSCRALLRDCPTRFICPVERPIKCDDGTCKQSVSQCSTATECSYGLKKCPDGSCTSNQCGTDVTCSDSAPYKCYDGTCKIDPRDCPQVPTCSSKAPILCPDGTCVSQRVNCKKLEACDTKTPVRCPDMKCYSDSSQCKSFLGCPIGKIMCEDGSCARHLSFCPLKVCPDHLPIRCADGFCVNNATFCSSNTTGCPFEIPFKCWNGQCVSNTTSCSEKIQCDQGKTLCPDGSCQFSCPNAMGCPPETPLRCANMECINPKKGNCSVALCPKNAPIKCLDGQCSSSITFCPSLPPSADLFRCSSNSSGHVPCADGRCVPSAELCRPVFSCPTGQVRCGDGTCRVAESFCPLVNSTCPSVRPYRCETGACAFSQSDCPTINNCPHNTPVKCSKSGICASNETECGVLDQSARLQSNCSFILPYRCPSGDCAASFSQCPTAPACQPSFKRCPAGQCVKNITECTPICKNYTCPDGSCVTSRSKCHTSTGCPIDQPFKCADGTCQWSPALCTPSVVCPKWKPYLCGDGECQGDSSHCRIVKGCPVNKPYRCADLRCVEDQSICNGQKCPESRPILCGNGVCVEEVSECQQVSTSYCPDKKPILCASGQCVRKYVECLSLNVPLVGRLLSEQALIQCSDGSVREKKEECPLIPACSPGDFRCKSGVCVKDDLECIQEDKGLLECTNNYIRCPDGICRESCIAFQGCPNDKGYHCANGLCARNDGECAGDAICPNSGFRCIDNSCVKNQHLCSTPLRSYPSEEFRITTSLLKTTTVEFIQKEESNVKLGKLTIPAGALLHDPNANATYYDTLTLVVKPVAESEIRNLTTSIELDQKDYVNEVFPNNDGVLYHHQAVRSPIVKIEAVNRSNDLEYRFPIILELSADILNNTKSEEDYCLAKANIYTMEWKCESKNFTNLESNRYAFPVQQAGTYSIVFSPSNTKVEKAEDNCDWLCENKMTVIYIVFGLIIASLISSYILWRVSRYIRKYRQAKKQMANYREQIVEMEKAKTDVLGQTLRDRLEGISFTTNPAFRKESNLDAKERENNLEKAIEKIMKRDKILEESNRELTKSNQILLEEIEELKSKLGKEREYHESMDIRKVERIEFE